MKKYVRGAIRAIIIWAFDIEYNTLERLNKESVKFGNDMHDLKSHVGHIGSTIDRLKEADKLLNSLDIAVDIHERSRSWAVIALQGKKADFVKFVDLGHSDIDTIARFLSRYNRDNRVIDATPNMTGYLKSQR